MIGYRISKIRTAECKKSTQAMADATGIERSLLMSYENDGVIPPDEHLQAIADFLGVTKSRLLGTDLDLSKFSISRRMTEEELDDFRDELRKMKKNPFKWERV